MNHAGIWLGSQTNNAQPLVFGVIIGRGGRGGGGGGGGGGAPVQASVAVHICLCYAPVSAPRTRSRQTLTYKRLYCLYVCCNVRVSFQCDEAHRRQLTSCTTTSPRVCVSVCVCVCAFLGALMDRTDFYPISTCIHIFCAAAPQCYNSVPMLNLIKPLVLC
jgi:hypothetical protein